jgi:hypothetical protein
MAINDEGSNGFYMPVAPAYAGGSNGGFGNSWGGDWGWIVLLLLLAGNGGWGFGGGFGGFGGAGNMMLGYDFPWILTGQQNINSNTNGGFRDAMLNDGITSIRDGISGLSTQLCNGFAGVNATVNSTAANAETAANARAIANMQQLYGLSSQFADCCCENRLGIADLKYTVATENCADRAALSDGIRDVIANQTAGVQRILDKLCDQELQAERRDNANLRSELMYARGQASQIEQTAALRAGQQAAVNSLVTELRSCPIPAQPVYGNQPIFQCSGPAWNNSGCGCGCGNGAF